MAIDREYLQAYSDEIWHCTSCDMDFHPLIKTRPAWMRFGIIAVVLGSLVYILYAPDEYPWGWLKLPWLLVLVLVSVVGFLMSWIVSRRRDPAESPEKVGYGQIIPICTRCGSPSVYLLMEGSRGRSYTFRP